MTKPHQDIGCNQGRIGMESVNASRVCLGLRPLHREFLHQQEGGETVESKPGFWDNWGGHIAWAIVSAGAIVASVLAPR